MTGLIMRRANARLDVNENLYSTEIFGAAEGSWLNDKDIVNTHPSYIEEMLLA
jgi:hypothetical protein